MRTGFRAHPVLPLRHQPFDGQPPSFYPSCSCYALKPLKPWCLRGGWLTFVVWAAVIRGIPVVTTRFPENLPFFFDGRIIMDIKRTILIVALAIVSYVMVLQWNQDMVKLPCRLRKLPPAARRRLCRQRFRVTTLKQCDDVPEPQRYRCTVTESVPVPPQPKVDSRENRCWIWAIDPRRVVTSPSCVCRCTRASPRPSRCSVSSCSITAWRTHLPGTKRPDRHQWSGCSFSGRPVFSATELMVRSTGPRPAKWRCRPQIQRKRRECSSNASRNLVAWTRLYQIEVTT